MNKFEIVVQKDNINSTDAKEHYKALKALEEENATLKKEKNNLIVEVQEIKDTNQTLIAVMHYSFRDNKKVLDIRTIEIYIKIINYFLSDSNKLNKPAIDILEKVFFVFVDNFHKCLQEYKLNHEVINRFAQILEIALYRLLHDSITLDVRVMPVLARVIDELFLKSHEFDTKVIKVLKQIVIKLLDNNDDAFNKKAMNVLTMIAHSLLNYCSDQDNDEDNHKAAMQVLRMVVVKLFEYDENGEFINKQNSIGDVLTALTKLTEFTELQELISDIIIGIDHNIKSIDTSNQKTAIKDINELFFNAKYIKEEGEGEEKKYVPDFTDLLSKKISTSDFVELIINNYINTVEENRFSEEVSLPKEANQFNEEVSLPKEANQFSEEVSLPEEANQFNEEVSLPKEANQFSEEVSLPEEANQFSEEGGLSAADLFEGDISQEDVSSEYILEEDVSQQEISPEDVERKLQSDEIISIAHL